MPNRRRRTGYAFEEEIIVKSEIERKYLIAPIERAWLESREGCAVWEIEQIYLTAEPGQTRRIRRVDEDGQTRY